MNKFLDDFNRMCGEILRLSLNVESSLEFFIENYFCYPQSHKTFYFHDFILVNLSFERKIQIFKKICKKEEVEEENLEKIIKNIRYVQRIRNKIAHFESHILKNKVIKLKSRKSVKFIEDDLKIDKNLLNEIRSKKESAINGINKIHLQLS